MNYKENAIAIAHNILCIVTKIMDVFLINNHLYKKTWSCNHSFRMSFAYNALLSIENISLRLTELENI